VVRGPRAIVVDTFAMALRESDREERVRVRVRALRRRPWTDQIGRPGLVLPMLGLMCQTVPCLPHPGSRPKPSSAGLRLKPKAPWFHSILTKQPAPAYDKTTIHPVRVRWIGARWGDLKKRKSLYANTRRQRGRIVGEFLLTHFGDQPIIMSTIATASVRRFVLGKHGRSAGSIHVIGGAIGCYLRFRSMSGDQVGDLAAAIPSAAQWRLASLPEVLTDAELDKLLRSFNQSVSSRRRGYAMVRCLIDLGLRCSEVVKLRLEDINWVEGTITLVGTKGRRADVLPLRRDRRRDRHLFA
jgi:integrase